MARQLVENLSEPFDPSAYQDDYHTNLMSIIRKKMKGKPIEFAEPTAPAATPVLDLMTRLQESLAQSKRTTPARAAGGRGGPRRSRAAKKRGPGSGSTTGAPRRRKSA